MKIGTLLAYELGVVPKCELFIVFAYPSRVAGWKHTVQFLSEFLLLLFSLNHLRGQLFLLITFCHQLQDGISYSLTSHLAINSMYTRRVQRPILATITIYTVCKKVFTLDVLFTLIFALIFPKSRRHRRHRARYMRFTCGLHNSFPHSYALNLGSRYVARFRSPNEFILHAHWLCIGAPLYPSPSNMPICQCKYCTGNENDAIEALASTSVYNSDEDDDDDGKKKKRRRSKSIFRNITHVKSRNKLQNRLLKNKKERFSQAEVSRQLTGRRPIRISTRNESKEEAEKEAEKETVKREHKGVGGAIWSSKK